jgi:cobalt-zinc-cadmium efflux system outer membrane protein
VQGDLAAPPLLPSLDNLLDQVLERYPALQQAQAEIRRSEAEVEREKAARLPTPSINGEWERQPDLGYYRIGISIPIPLWNRREGPIAEAEARLTQSNAFADLQRLEITAALERAYGQYEVASQQVAAFQDGVLKEAEAAVEAAEAAYRFGERGIIEVLDAQRVLRTVRTDYLNARFDRQQALIELERLRAVDLKGPTP